VKGGSVVRALALVCTAFAALLPAGAATAAAPVVQPSGEARIALVIGNAAYRSSPLLNPTNDATDIARRLEELGFKVILKLNADQREMKRSIREFSAALRGGGVGLFYFAGHGVQSRGRNYLLPVSADVQNEYELEDESVDANLVLGAMDAAQTRVNIVILDACRNNPFAKAFRSVQGGLAQMEAARGTLIAFATAPGSVAQDGIGRNGMYTKHVLLSLKEPDTDVERVFKRVAQGVARETAGTQVPWVSSSLTGDFYFMPPAARPAVSAAGAPSGSDTGAIPIVGGHPILLQIELSFWDTIKASGNPEEYEAYLSQYPDGRFAGLAKTRIRSLRSK
jgi:uncharacterized caspase-like protein